MQFFNRFFHVLEHEITLIVYSSQNWWDGLDTLERLAFVCSVGGIFMILALNRKREAKLKDFQKARDRHRTIASFYAALTVVLIFSLGIDTLVDQVVS